MWSLDPLATANGPPLGREQVSESVGARQWRVLHGEEMCAGATRARVAPVLGMNRQAARSVRVGVAKSQCAWPDPRTGRYRDQAEIEFGSRMGAARQHRSYGVCEFSGSEELLARRPEPHGFYACAAPAKPVFSAEISTCVGQCSRARPQTEKPIV